MQKRERMKSMKENGRDYKTKFDADSLVFCRSYLKVYWSENEKISEEIRSPQVGFKKRPFGKAFRRKFYTYGIIRLAGKTLQMVMAIMYLNEDQGCLHNMKRRRLNDNRQLTRNCEEG
uniref:Uncharacterized protein n=1 Tax=Glossina pallidipes TaxID=7398 RepID=A0A1B0AD91_GLOPL